MLRSLFFLLFNLLLFSAFLTPVFYTGIDAVYDGEMWPFSRIYDRVALLVLVVLLWFGRKNFNLKSIKTDFPLWQEKKASSKFLFGFFITLLPVLLLLPLMIVWTPLEWKSEDASYYVLRLLKLIPTVLLVSLLEELIFRVFLFWKLKERFNLVVGILLTALFYAFVHFITPVKTFVYDSFDLLAGFEYYAVVSERIASFDLLSAGIIMFIIGVILCLSLNQSRSFFFVAGLHGGWIASLKITKYTTYVGGEGITSKALERYYLLTLPLTWLAIASSATILFFLFKNDRTKKFINCQ